ncbi:MAG: DNA polymerase III subunit delta' [Sterolibacteriaceae bacterium MAG5]|nr:DNA polymerase III subunit delta' [Candidatus Nitricoxidireducens bremensis]
MLLVGVKGVGKSLFAMAMAQRLLCEHPASRLADACGDCPSCRLFQSGNHPDFRHVIPEADIEEGEADASSDSSDKKKSNQILIAQIRALEDFVYIGGHRSNRRVILIEPAEAMNVPAANSLLKILEEPPSGVYFILVSNRQRSLLPTIKSRCRTLSFGRPDPADAEAWLTRQEGGKKALSLLGLMAGAPIVALEEYERGRIEAFEGVALSLFDNSADFMALAGRWESMVKKDGGLRMEELIATIQKWIFDLANFKTTGRLRYFSGRERQAEGLVAKTNIDAILKYYNELLRIRGLAGHPLNPKLFLEDVAARYLRAIAPSQS